MVKVSTVCSNFTVDLATFKAEVKKSDGSVIRMAVTGIDVNYMFVPHRRDDDIMISSPPEDIALVKTRLPKCIVSKVHIPIGEDSFMSVRTVAMGGNDIFFVIYAVREM